MRFEEGGLATQEQTAREWDPYLFGGSEKHVRRTHARFLPWFSNGAPILDIGCGRGIFLELLRERGLEGVGIDTNPEAVSYCRDRGLRAEQADALAYLSDHPESFGGIFCSHVVEHLPFETARTLVERCAAALLPGGKLVVMTPNSADFGVMGDTFWLDPTHVRPYPVRLLGALADAAGLRLVASGSFHGALARRDIPRTMLLRAFLGPFYGRPNAYIVAQRPAR